MTALQPTLRRASFELLRVLLHTVHFGVISFTIVGWASCHTRALHLVLMALIALSWFGLGYFRGFGYCLITDWQWRLMARLGEEVPSGGYIKFLGERLTGWSLDNDRLDRLTTGAYAAAVTASLAASRLYGFC